MHKQKMHNKLINIIISNTRNAKLRYKILAGLLFVFIIWVIAIQFETYKYPDKEEIDKRLNYLERVVNEPLDNKSEIMQLKYESYEFMLFSYAYTAYAATNIATRDTLYRQRAIYLIKECIDKALDRNIYSPYKVDEALINSDSIPNFSVLYLGHLNLMMGCYRLLSEDNTFNSLNDKISASLFRRYNETEFLNLESYSSAIWIPDNTVALASLKLHGSNTNSGYESVCYKWVEYAKKNYIDEETGVLYSTVSSMSEKAEEEPRGSMLGWSIMFIYQFDKNFAIELYNNYKEHFSHEYFIFILFKERSSIRGTADIDSGPIILGYSIPANEFALGGAVIAEDYKTARKLERLINFGARKICKNNEIRYKLRLINMNISPMAEALVLYSLTLTEWVVN